MVFLRMGYNPGHISLGPRTKASMPPFNVWAAINIERGKGVDMFHVILGMCGPGILAGVVV